jgi:hypothetical protein
MLTNCMKPDWFKGAALDSSVYFNSWNFFQFLVTFYVYYLCWKCMWTFLYLVLLVPSHCAFRFSHAFSFRGKNIKMFELWWSSYEFLEIIVKIFIFHGCTTLCVTAVGYMVNQCIMIFVNFHSFWYFTVL